MSNEPKEPLLLEHEYDGIQELDNNLPRWWLWLFYISIIFSAIYMVYYHVYRAGDKQFAADGQQLSEYKREMKAGEALKAAAVGKFEFTIAGLQPATNNAAVLETGRQVYGKYCLPCHRVDGGGLVGPNLTDNYWIHGNTYADSVKIIWDGVPAKGMISWKTVLKPEEIQAVASYIYTLRGAKLAAPGKPPENTAPAAQPAAPSAFE
jgi:cytochrome c oxidase cbb3-type subunit 3